ncbi:hypothetical protein SISSUDRAFT_402324 [Sistotremastrum suecicum HHB10207 ss-3]|uniref:Uncharacterized protein n=1 Tax=Sistotremastrum suecicum HHB10207 ss-3 TaxID=1314776 RepID=A0A166FSR1_9AGAM|nr:hypothetical protein SISSUDRAFT_402324 [Sistotremastrum suecicum HHB10207 ss-3]
MATASSSSSLFSQSIAGIHARESLVKYEPSEKSSWGVEMSPPASSRCLVKGSSGGGGGGDDDDVFCQFWSKNDVRGCGGRLVEKTLLFPLAETLASLYEDETSGDASPSYLAARRPMHWSGYNPALDSMRLAHGFLGRFSVQVRPICI